MLNQNSLEILKKINEKFPLTNEEVETINSYFQIKKLRKRQYLLQSGDVCRFKAYVEKGILKQYSVDKKGTEHIVQFATEGWIISDLSSFMSGEPAVYNIDALEETELLIIKKSEQKELFKKVPKYEVFTRLEITNAYSMLQKRLTAMISTSMEERYLEFISRYPNITQRVPQHMIASYLGLNPETLSRIRKKLNNKI